MDDLKNQLFGVMSVAEEQQQSITKLLEDLKAERDTFEKRNQQMAASIKGIQHATDGIQSAARAAVTQNLEGAAALAVKAASESVEPLFEQIKAATDNAHQASQKLNRAADGVGNRMLMYAIAGAFFLTFCSVAAGWIVGAWTENEVVALRQERAVLAAQVADFERRAGKAVLNSCGDKKRLCVQIDTKEKYGEKSDWAVIKGY